MTLTTFAKKMNELILECEERGLNPNFVPVEFFLEDKTSIKEFTDNGFPFILDEDSFGTMSVLIGLEEY